MEVELRSCKGTWDLTGYGYLLKIGQDLRCLDLLVNILFLLWSLKSEDYELFLRFKHSLWNLTATIGDHIARDIGVIWVPDIQKYSIDHKRSIIVIWSDGIHEFISNQELSQFVVDHRNQKAQDVAKLIVDMAIRRWKKNDIFVDDCTCQIIYLNNPKIS